MKYFNTIAALFYGSRDLHVCTFSKRKVGCTVVANLFKLFVQTLFSGILIYSAYGISPRISP